MEYILGNDKNCEINIVLVTGACRSGKTLISKLLSSMNNVEWIEEPWMLLQLPILYHLNLIDKDIAISCVKSYVKELLNDNVLLRNANFRPKDLSSIWNVKDPRNIFYRLNDLNTREDVSNYLGKNNTVLLIDIPEIHPFLDFFYDAFNDIKIIHVVRNGFNVAEQIASKKWYSKENLKEPKNNLLYYKYNNLIDEFYIPWWVESNMAENFINMNEISKGFYYWIRMMNFNDFYNKEKNFRNYQIVKYEDLVLNPSSIVEKLGIYIDVEKTNLTKQIMCEIHSNELGFSRNINIEKIDSEIMNVAKLILENYGYRDTNI